MKNKPSQSKRAEECIRAWRSTGTHTDVLGSYTGVCKDLGHMMGVPLYSPNDGFLMVDDDLEPVQDVDDL